MHEAIGRSGRCRGTRANGRKGPRRGARAWLAGLLACALAPLLVGCGSTTASSYSAGGVRAAGENVAASLQAGNFRKACEGLTEAARSRLLVLPASGCPGALALARGLLAVQGKQGLGQTLRQRLERLLTDVQISGDQALYHGVVEARYEQGRWHLEAHGSDAAVNPRTRAKIEGALAGLESQGAGALLMGAAPPGG